MLRPSPLSLSSEVTETATMVAPARRSRAAALRLPLSFCLLLLLYPLLAAATASSSSSSSSSDPRRQVGSGKAYLEQTEDPGQMVCWCRSNINDTEKN